MRAIGPIDIRCPLCGKLLIVAFDGIQVQVDCKSCRIEVRLKRKSSVTVTA